MTPLLLALFLLPAPAPTARPVTALQVPDIPYQRFVLGNGLVLIVHEDHKAPIAAVNVWYHVGSKNEKPGRTGFAHLFEHLMFNGSENFNDDYFKVLERLGATDLNGTTNVDRTNYFQNVPVSALDTVLWMESDRMGHLLGAIDQARLDEQRGVVQNEKRQGENEPYGKVYGIAQQNTYPAGHPYSWTTIGSMEDLQAAALEDVKEWFRTYYGAANAVLVVAGDVKAEDVKARVERHFGDIPAGPPVSRQQAWIAARTGTHRQILEDRVPQARIYKIWNTPEAGSADDPLLDMMGRALASGKTSRLYKRLVYDEQIATAVSATQDTSEIGSQFVIEATARPGADLVQVEKAIDEELVRMLAQGPTAAELQRAQVQDFAALVRGVERIGGFGGKSDLLARGEVYEGRPDAYKVRAERVRAATPFAVRDAGRRWLSDGQYVLEVHPFPKLQAAKDGVDRSQVPAAGTPPAARFPEFQRATLSNGLKVIVAEIHAVPAVRFDLLVDAGYAADPAGGAGTARLAGDMLDEGTATRSALQISDELDQAGAVLATGSSVDTTMVSLSALTARLDPALAVFGDVILHPSFPAADFDRLRQQQLVAIQQEAVQPFSMALRVMPRLLYGEGHAYANPLTGSGTGASVQKLTREDMARFHATWFKPGNATLVVVGDTTLAAIEPKLEALFAPWTGGEVPKKAVGPAPRRTAAAVYLLDRPGAEQSLILAGQATLPRNNPQEVAIEAMNRVLGGTFTSRINMNLREDKHWSYGSRSFFLDARGDRPFVAYAPVQSDKTKESMVELARELSEIQAGRPISGEELTKAQEAMTLRLSGRWETGRAVAGSLGDIVTYGLPDRYFDGYAGVARALTASDVNAVAKVFDPQALVWVVIGDRARIEEGVKSLGFGPLQYLDADGNVLP